MKSSIVYLDARIVRELNALERRQGYLVVYWNPTPVMMQKGKVGEPPSLAAAMLVKAKE